MNVLDQSKVSVAVFSKEANDGQNLILANSNAIEMLEDKKSLDVSIIYSENGDVSQFG